MELAVGQNIRKSLKVKPLRPEGHLPPRKEHAIAGANKKDVEKRIDA